MKRSLFTLLLTATLALGIVFAAEESDDEVNARKVAMELAGAFSNDGFKLRDGHWMGSFALGKAAIHQVNLFAGNEYWFSLGTTDKAKKVAVSVFDETGKPVAYEPYQDGASAAAGFSPAISGPYLIKVEVIEGAPASFCLLYSYK
jgi:hypothetical protein